MSNNIFRSISSSVDANIERDDILVFSLDCWGTIIDPKKYMWLDIAGIIREAFSVGARYSKEEVVLISKRINKNLDDMTAISGVEYSQSMRILALARSLRLIPNDEQLKNLMQRIEQYVQLRGRDSVLLLEGRIKEMLTRIRANGKKVVLLSNSGLISGGQTRDILKNLGILQFFNGVFLSDEIGASKPSPKIFSYMVKKLKDGGMVSNSSQILHIGDNRILDYNAALANGFNAALITRKVRPNGALAANYVVKFSTNSITGELESSSKGLTIKQYSAIKFGVLSEVKSAARLLYNNLMNVSPVTILGVKPPIFIECFRYIRPASALLLQEVKEHVDVHRISIGLNPSEVLRVARAKDDLSSYSHLPAYKRQEYLFHDMTVGNATHDPSCPTIVIDDIYVSGTFTTKIEQTLSSAGFTNVSFYYLVRCDTEEDYRSVSLENRINSSLIRSLADLECYIKRQDLLPTRKYYKLLLSSGEDEIIRHLAIISGHMRKKVADDLTSILGDLSGDYREKCQFVLARLTEGVIL